MLKRSKFEPSNLRMKKIHEEFNTKESKFSIERNTMIAKIKGFQAWQKQWFILFGLMAVAGKLQALRFSRNVILYEMEKWENAARLIQSKWRRFKRLGSILKRGASLAEKGLLTIQIFSEMGKQHQENRAKHISYFINQDIVKRLRDRLIGFSHKYRKSAWIVLIALRTGAAIKKKRAALFEAYFDCYMYRVGGRTNYPRCILKSEEYRSMIQISRQRLPRESSCPKLCTRCISTRFNSLCRALPRRYGLHRLEKNSIHRTVCCCGTIS